MSRQRIEPRTSSNPGITCVGSFESLSSKGRHLTIFSCSSAPGSWICLGAVQFGRAPLNFGALAWAHTEPSCPINEPLIGTNADGPTAAIQGLMHRASMANGKIPITLPVRSTDPIYHHTCTHGLVSNLSTAVSAHSTSNINHYHGPRKPP